MSKIDRMMSDATKSIHDLVTTLVWNFGLHGLDEIAYGLNSNDPLGRVADLRMLENLLDSMCKEVQGDGWRDGALLVKRNSGYWINHDKCLRDYHPVCTV